MNTSRFVTEGGGLVAALTRKVYYTAKTLDKDASSGRSAITADLTNGCVLCYDPFGWDKGQGVDATRPEDGSDGDNRAMIAGYVVGLRGAVTSAQYVDVVPFTPGTCGNPLTDATQTPLTPTYLKPVTGSFALALATMDGTVPADEPLARAVSMDIVDTDTTNARAAVYFC